MSENEVIKVNVSDFNENQVPDLIQSQFTKLANLKEHVERSMSKANNAQNKAKIAKNKSAGMFSKKEAIESLQGATMDLADAQVSAAEAQKISFEYQQKLGEITKYLFGLGVTNITLNRTVVREITARLKGASEEELDDLARKELISVVNQLKAQEDIMKKQADLTNRVKRNENQLKAQDIKDVEYEKQLMEREKKDEEHDRLIAEQVKKDEEHDRLIAEQVKKDEEHDRLILEQAQKDVEHDRLFLEQKQKNEMYDKEFAEINKENKELQNQFFSLENRADNIDENIKLIEQKCTEQAKLIEKQAEDIQLLNDEIQKLQLIVERKVDKFIVYLLVFVVIITFILSLTQLMI